MRFRSSTPCASSALRSTTRARGRSSGARRHGSSASAPSRERARASACGGSPREADLRAGAGAQQADAILQAFADALDDRTLLREELADEVSRRVGEWARGPISSGWAFLIGDAADAGVLCHGPPRGSKVTFVRPDQWLGGVHEVDGQTALGVVARRF